jgi:biopolymer transport protein ExbD
LISMDDDSGDEGLIKDINIVPMVDITLVVLIIFIVTATYIVSRAIPVDLPKASTGEDVGNTVAITINKKGEIFYEGEKVSGLPELRTRVEAAKVEKKDVRAVISADKDITHGTFVSVVNMIRKAGVPRFAINIKEEDIVVE